MESKVIRQVKAEGSDLVAVVNGVEVFRGRAGAIVDRAYNIVEAAEAHTGPFKVESEVRNNRRFYFVKAGNMILKESASAGKIHDFADRLNGVKTEAVAADAGESAPHGSDAGAPLGAPDSDLFADQ